MSDGESRDSSAATGMPMVSVIVAVYNGGRYLSAALDSVFAQNYHPVEVILVDDGSTDNTASIAQSYRAVRYIYQDHQGVAAARNNGISAVRGEFVAFQDADDLWVPRKLAIQTGHLLANPQVDGTIGMHLNFADGTAPGIRAADAEDRISLQTLVARRALFDRVGAYDSTYRVASDMEWFTRAREQGETIVTLPVVLAYRRIHDDNISWQSDARVESLLRMFKACIDRKKKGTTQDETRNH